MVATAFPPEHAGEVATNGQPRRPHPAVSTLRVMRRRARDREQIEDSLEAESAGKPRFTVLLDQPLDAPDLEALVRRVPAKPKRGTWPLTSRSLAILTSLRRGESTGASWIPRHLANGPVRRSCVKRRSRHSAPDGIATSGRDALGPGTSGFGIPLQPSSRLRTTSQPSGSEGLMRRTS